MNKKLVVVLGIAMFCLLATGSIVAQDKKIRLVKGQKMILKGNVRDGTDRSYFFKAKKGQMLTVKVIGRDAMFTIFAMHNFDAEAFAEDVQSWSGRLPNADSGEYSIRMISNYKVASYRLEILLK